MLMKHLPTTLLAALLFVSVAAIGQKPPDKWKTQQIVVNAPNLTIKAEVEHQPREIKSKDNLIYAWFKSGEIVETQGGSHGRLLDGAYAEFYINHQLKRKGTYKHGLKHGEWRAWDEQGKLLSVKHFRNGLLHGSLVQYDAEGKPTLKATYKNGALHGETTAYDQGKELSRKRYRKGEELGPKTPWRPWKRKQAPAPPPPPDSDPNQ